VIVFIVGYIIGKDDSNKKGAPIKKCNAEVKKEIDLRKLVDEHTIEDYLRRSIRNSNHDVLDPVYGIAGDLIWEPEKYSGFYALLKWGRIGDRILWMVAEINYPTAQSKGTEYNKLTIPISINPSWYGDYGLMLEPESYNWVLRTVMKAEGMLQEVDDCQEG
jgi:hypothetical protein